MITVIFSSSNGGSDLKRMLDSLTRLQAPAGGWALIAIDNASSDGTGDVMRSYADRLPITVLHEPLNGKNRALNRALDVAKGDFYIFTDDDVLVPGDWLVKWREVADAQPAYDLFAGLTQPFWSLEPQQWILRGINISVVYAIHIGPTEGPHTASCMHGTNMAIRASAFKNGLRFDTGIGPDGSSNYAMGSDTELVLRLEKQGLKCWFATGPFVEHIVPPEHLEPSWILGRGYRWGRGLARMNIPHHAVPDVLARKNTLKMIVYPFLLPFLRREDRWRRQWQFMVDQGYEDGTREKHVQKLRWRPSE